MHHQSILKTVSIVFSVSHADYPGYSPQDVGKLEAVARAGALLARRGQPLPLSRLQLKKELLADYKDFLPDLPADAARRIRGEQDVIVTYERDAAIEALPKLLTKKEDRERFLTLLVTVQRVKTGKFTLRTGSA